MNERRSRLFAAVATVGLLGLPAMGWAQQATILKLRDLEASKPALVTRLVALENDAATHRWLGIGIESLPDLLKAHLKLDHGALVADVYPDSPAAKAGIEKNDILLSVNGQKITEPIQVRDAVANAEGGESLKLTALRAGEEKSFEVVPADRPSEADLLIPGDEPSGAAATHEEFLKHQKQALKALEKAIADRQAAGMMFLRPGIVTAKPLELPKGVSVTIKHHDGKKSITVERGDDKWEVTESTLDKLPEDLRETVASLLGPTAAVKLHAKKNVQIVPGAPVIDNMRVEVSPFAGRPLAGKERLDGDPLDAVMKELKALRKQVEELQRSVKNNN